MTVMLTSVATTALAQVVPSGLAHVSGSTNISLLYGADRPTRVQQVCLGADLPSGSIKEIRFRQDEVLGTAGSCTLSDVTVVLSSTTATPDGLSLTFADNHGADQTTVYSGDLVLSSAASTADPRPFDMVVSLTTPFLFDGTTGKNLLIDITAPVADPVFPCSGFPLLDSEYQAGDGVSIVYCWDGLCTPSMTTANDAHTGGMVLLLVFDIVFADDFESGDTSQWSATAP